MKRRYVLGIGILIGMVLMALLIRFCWEKYPSGKDTALSVGNGRFQVLGGAHYGLFVSGMSYCIDGHVREYYDDTREQKLYLISEGGYIVVDYQAETYKQYDEMEDCTQEDQAVFRDESRFAAFGQ